MTILTLCEDDTNESEERLSDVETEAYAMY